MHGEEPKGLINGRAGLGEGFGYSHAATPAGEGSDEVVRACDVEEGGDGGDTAVEVADEVGADVGEDEFSSGEGFGAELRFEAVDMDAVSCRFCLTCDWIGGVETSRRDKEGEFASFGFGEHQSDVAVRGGREELEAGDKVVAFLDRFGRRRGS